MNHKNGALHVINLSKEREKQECDFLCEKVFIPLWLKIFQGRNKALM
jgi:hypothetical protein